MSIQHHDWHTADGYHYGKVAVIRGGTIPRNSKGEVIYYLPEDVRRGDIILDLSLAPLRANHQPSRKDRTRGRRRHTDTERS